VKRRSKLLVCGSKKCRQRGSMLLMARLGELLADLPELRLEPVGCQKRCKHGCVAVLEGKKTKVWEAYTPEDALKLAEKVRKRLTKWRQGAHTSS
jgi:NADH:ubiquinone oxidoreductase subunit E